MSDAGIDKSSTTEGELSERRGAMFWLDVSLAALALRLLLVPVAPYFGYPGDHDDFVRWGMQAVRDGVVTVYDHAPPRGALRVREAGQWTTTQRNFDRLCNYPPGSVYRQAVSAWVFERVRPDGLMNTPASQYCFSAWAIVADFVTAAGCAALVARLGRAAAARWVYAVMLFLPPLWWDSVIWGQTDTILLAPAVWMIWALLARRWILAGVLLGVAAAMKPQAILFLPAWGLAVLALRPRWKPVAALGVGVATTMLIALPFTVHSGWAWFRASYWENLTSTYANLTTLKAFNVWYVDLLITLSDDATSRLMGVSRDGWGKAMLLAALLAGLGWAVWRWRGREGGLVLYTVASLLAFMMLPTQVHERYLVLVLPFLGVAAFVWRGLAPGFVILSVVALAQVTWPIWLRFDPVVMPDVMEAARRAHVELRQYDPHQLPEELRSLPGLEETFRRAFQEERGKTLFVEWGLTGLALVGAAWTWVAALRARPAG